jgi:glycosyltransferase involved in cell wall biosynthesis
MLYKKHPDWKLYMVGDGDYRAQAEQYVKKRQLNNVVFTGFVAPEPYYRKAQIIVLTSNFEGTPMVIPEAMAYKVVPVVMNNFTGATVHIKNGYNGFLTPKFDSKAMAEKINLLIENGDLRNKMATHAQESIKPFDIQIIGKYWEKLLEDLV